MKKTKFRTRLPLFIATIIFSLASFDAFFNLNFWLGFLNLFMAITNITATKYFQKYPELNTVFLGILNAIVAFITAWIFIEAGKEYIQFAWILTGVVYLFVSFRLLNLAQKKYL
jgi:hypothetical protein